MAKQRAGKVALGAAIAAGVGYVAGVLTAPKSGKATRKDIEKTASKAKKEAEKKLKELHSDLDNLIGKGKKQAKDAGDKAKTGIGDAVDKAQTAKDKAREVLSAIHEGEASDKELQKAIDEVKKATKHLKTFVTKDVKTKAKK